MKTLAALLVVVSALLSGCAVSSANKRPRAEGNLAQMAANARTYQKADGNLSADYAVDLVLNGSDSRQQTPVMALPRPR